MQPLTQDYAHQALEQIRSAVKGNGLKTDAVTLDHFEGAPLEIAATTTLTLTTKTAERRIAGQVRGPTPVENAQALREQLEQEKKDATTTQASTIRAAIEQREDQGIGLKNQTIKLPFLTKEFVYPEPCGPCRGKGDVHCRRCHGKGYEICPVCRGETFQRCTLCSGAGQVTGRNGQYESCTRCNGQRTIPCTKCQQRGRSKCSVCKTTGSTHCKQCNGHGIISVVVQSEVFALANFDYTKTDLSPEIITQLDQLGPALKDHVDIVPVTTETAEITSSNNVTLTYKLQIPQGKARFKLGEETLETTLFGKNATLTGAGNFLEPILKRGLEKLSAAANGQGNAEEDLRSAARYKTIRHAVMAAAKYPKKKAIAVLLKNTPIGLDTHLAARLIDDATLALKNVTGKSKMRGIAIGVIITLALIALYAFTPARLIAHGLITDDNLRLALDVVVGIAALALGYILIRGQEQSARKKFLNSLSTPPSPS